MCITKHVQYSTTIWLHIQFQAPDDGRRTPETCRALLTIKIVNLLYLVGYTYHFHVGVILSVLMCEFELMFYYKQVH
jgi:hypothetical protein